MDFIFGNNYVLKKEYEEMVKDLPKLNKCGFCQKLHCSFCKKYTFNCRNCIKEKCKNCFKFNISKNLLINSSNQVVSDFVKKKLFDYFKTSGLTNYFLKMDINFFVKEKMNYKLLIILMKLKKNGRKTTEKPKKSNIINQKNILIILNCNFLKKNGVCSLIVVLLISLVLL